MGSIEIDEFTGRRRGKLTCVNRGCSGFMIYERQFAEIVALAQDCYIHHSAVVHLFCDFYIL